MIKFVYSFLFLTAFSTLCLSQTESERCLSKQAHAWLKKHQEGYAQQRIKAEKTLQRRIAINKSKKTAETVYTIPLVVHVVHLGEAVGVGNNISEAQVLSGIDQLNDAFRNVSGESIDTKIQFKLATIDPNCASTTGIIRVDGSGVNNYTANGLVFDNTSNDNELEIKALSKWDNSSYYNIWIVSEIGGNNGGNGTQGFAYFPGSSSGKDGAVVMNTAWGNQGTVNNWNNMGSTIIHEMGHALDLFHTFEGDEDNMGNPQCPPGDCGDNIGDCCSDTSPHKRSSSNCPTSAINSCTGLTNDDVIKNYMDYSSQNCQTMFTSNQKDRMRAALETERSGLINSNAFSTNLSSFVAAKNASCTPTTDPNWGLLGGYSGIMFAEISGVITNSSSHAKNDGGYVNDADECTKTGFINLGGNYTFRTEIWNSLENHNVMAWIDYNNNGSFSSDEMIYSNNLKGGVVGSASFTVPSTAVTNTYLRMRVLCDILSFSDACHNPQYGQAEDYPIHISSSTKQGEVSVLSFEVTPNPFSDHIQVSNTSLSPMTYKIITLTGQEITGGRLKDKITTINTSTIPSGSYILYLQSEQNSFSKKIIKL